MQGYIESYDERAAEIEKNFSYDGYQIVRREMFAHLREPAITIRKDSITFNTACIEGLEDAVYINIMVSDDEKRIVIRKCEENDMESVRWCVAKADKRKSRNIKGEFSKGIYELMEWTEGCRYKVLGHRISYEGDTLYVFELERYEKFKERRKRTKEEKEERKKTMTPEAIAEEDKRERRESMIPFSPLDAENTFGLPVDQYSRTIDIGSLSSYEKVDVPIRNRSQKNAAGMPYSPSVRFVEDAINGDSENADFGLNDEAEDDQDYSADCDSKQEEPGSGNREIVPAGYAAVT